ncbi:MAG: FAD-dependent oxidoreductase [Pseudomonadota bacterium]
MTAKTNQKSPEVLVLGAGIIGLSCAMELARRGVKVAIYDEAWPPRGASWVAAGMLAPAHEAIDAHHPKLFDLCLASSGLWSEFRDFLENEGSTDIGYRAEPKLVVVKNQDLKWVQKRLALLSEMQIPHRFVEKTELSELEPAITTSAAGAIALETDHQVDNRAVIRALIAGCETLGVERLSDPKKANIVLRTTGWQSRGVSPVKGQIISLAPRPGSPKHVINYNDLYIVPKEDRIVVGATSEEGSSDTETNPEATEDLLEKALEIVPCLRDNLVIECIAGVRPSPPDHAPVLGRMKNGDFIATGHYRNGILLAPITAQIMADMILDEKVSDLAAAFSPDRFA